MPDDPWLPDRLKAQAGIVRGEASILKAALAALKRLATAIRGAVGPDGLPNVALLNNRMPEWRAAVQDILLPTIGEVFGQAFRKFLDQAVYSPDQYIEQYLATVDNRLVGVADEVFNAIRLELEEGRRLGEGIPELAKRVKAQLGPEATDHRAMVIARTETIGAYNQGQFAAARVLAEALDIPESSVVKRWLSTDDDRTRPTHVIADNQMQYMNQPFVVGGALGMAPGDPRFPADEVIQCRCTVLFLFPGDLGYPAGGLTAAAEGDTMSVPFEENPGPVRWHGVLTVENLMSGDNRRFADDSLRQRPLPLPLSWQPENWPGHDGSVVVGNIEGMRRVGNSIRGWGTFGDSAEARKVTDQIANRLIRGVSVDVDDSAAQFETPDGEMPDEEDFMTGNVVMVVTKGRVAGATLCAIPAFVEAEVQLGAPPADWIEDGEALAEEFIDVDDDFFAGLVASAKPVELRDAFSNPNFQELTPLAIEGDHIYGHLAGWSTCHLSFKDQCVTAPHSATNYSWFHTGAVKFDDGTAIPVGQITMDTGHAKTTLAAGPAIEHYDHTGAVVADVRMGEDQHGIWFNGLMRKDVPDEKREALQAAALSGDWRRLKGHLELVAALAVNTPGFPIPRTETAVANRQQVSLVASGVVQKEPVASLDYDPIRLAAALEKGQQILSNRRHRLHDAAVIMGRDNASRLAQAEALLTEEN